MAAYRLGQKALAHARRSQQQHVRFVADELAGRQVKDLLAFDGWIEAEVKFIQRFALPEHRGADTPFDQPAGPYRQFIRHQ
jgi:hypothetical protein